MKTDGNSVWKDERIYEEPEKNAFELPDIIPNNPIEKKTPSRRTIEIMDHQTQYQPITDTR